MNRNSHITNGDLYEAINDLRKEMLHRIELVEAQVDSNTAWRNQVTGKLTALFVVIGIAINWVWDLLFNRA